MTNSVEKPIDVGPRITPPHERDSRWPAIFAILAAALAAIAMFGGYQYWERHQAIQRISPLIQLHPEGWSNAELEDLAVRLAKLGSSSCDIRALEDIASRLEKKGNGADAAAFYASVLKRCPHNYEFTYKAWLSAQKAGDFSLSLEIAEKLVKEEPASAAARALRGTSNEARGELRLALGDYLSAFEMLGDKSRIAGSEFLRLARTFAKLDEYCNAVSILELFTSFDPLTRKVPQVQALIDEYGAKGQCFSTTAPTTIRGTKLGQHLLVSAVVNGVSAKLLVDTGATFSALTPAFAQKAGTNFDGREILMHTFAGALKVRMGRISTLTIGSYTAKEVDVVPLPEARNIRGNYDGVVGMNFLSRAGFRLLEDRLELGTR